MAWGDDAKKAMQENPDYFVWWYTVKSVGLGVVAAVAAYYIGKDAGRRSKAFGNLSGKGPFSMDAFDVFSVDNDVVTTPADLFRNSSRGYTFTAGGRQWKVVRDDVGLDKRLIAPVEPRTVRVGGNYEPEGSYYAELVDGTLVVSNLAKRGEFRPVGRPVLREKLAGLTAKGRIPDSAVDYAMRKLASKVEKCGITKAQMREGMSVEREHGDVTHRTIEKTARIAAAHICERPDYYKRLKRYVE